MLLWSRSEIVIFLIIALVPNILYSIIGFKWLHLPWLPIALIGTAVAFIIGFQNNVAYDRIWEARKIWGGIVNTSRTFAVMIKDFITNEHAKLKLNEKELTGLRKKIIHRHIAWLTSLRYAMRQHKPWEVFLEHRTNREWAKNIYIPEVAIPLEEGLKSYLSIEEYEYVMEKHNKSVAILSLQSKQLRDLKEKGLIWEFSFLELENQIKDLLDHQGKSERIKNFPYPRQYATLNNYFVWIFIVLLPFGVIPEFSKIGITLSEHFPEIGKWFVWGSIPFIMIVSWVFHTMQRIGTVGENPFEGSANDVPISAISRGIEVDVLEIIDEQKDKIPGPFPVKYNVQM